MRVAIDGENGGLFVGVDCDGSCLDEQRAPATCICALFGSVWGVWGIWNRRHSHESGTWVAAVWRMVAVLALLMEWPGIIPVTSEPMVIHCQMKLNRPENKDISIESMRDNGCSEYSDPAGWSVSIHQFLDWRLLTTVLEIE